MKSKEWFGKGVFKTEVLLNSSDEDEPNDVGNEVNNIYETEEDFFKDEDLDNDGDIYGYVHSIKQLYSYDFSQPEY